MNDQTDQEIEILENMVADAIRELPRTEQLIISLHYYEGLTMEEIGEVLGLTESEVSQMHEEILSILRRQVKEVNHD